VVSTAQGKGVPACLQVKGGRLEVTAACQPL
jgi:hypothetical protein